MGGVPIDAGHQAVATAKPTKSFADRFPAALNRAARPSDTLPASMVYTLQAPDRAGRFGVDPSTAREVAAFGDERLLLVRGGGNVCAVQLTVSMQSVSCGSEEALANSDDGMLTTQVAPGGKLRVFGPIEEGASQAKLLLRSGEVIDMPVQGGAVSATVDSPPSSISWTAADGSAESTALSLPSQQP